MIKNKRIPHFLILDDRCSIVLGKIISIRLLKENQNSAYCYLKKDLTTPKFVLEIGLDSNNYQFIADEDAAEFLLRHHDILGDMLDLKYPEKIKEFLDLTYSDKEE